MISCFCFFLRAPLLRARKIFRRGLIHIQKISETLRITFFLNRKTRKKTSTTNRPWKFNQHKSLFAKTGTLFSNQLHNSGFITY